MLAVAERIDLEEVTALVDTSVLERLEDGGVIDLVDDGGRPLVVLAHPLYGEAVLATMPTLRRRRVCGLVADAVETAGMPRPGDLVRVVTWRLDAGRAVDLEQLTTAARRAYNAHDLGLADRLAAAARAHGGGVEAGLVLAETAMLLGRHEQAAALLDDLAGEATTDQQHVDVADSRAIALGLYLGREHEALAVVNETLTLVHDPDLVDRLRASLAIVLAQAPKPRLAIEAARPLLDRPTSPSFPRGAYAASVAAGAVGSPGAGDRGRPGVDMRRMRRSARQPTSCPRPSSSGRSWRCPRPVERSMPTSWLPRGTTPRSAHSTPICRLPLLCSEASRPSTEVGSRPLEVSSERRRP